VRRLALLLAALAGGAVGLLTASPAYAHAALVSSDPADGVRLTSVPAEVVLRFNEPVEPAPEPLRVFDAGGGRVDAGDPVLGGDRSVLRVSLRPHLPDGVYVVAYRVVSADAHPIHGSVTFAVGEVEDAALAEAVAAVPDGDQPGWEVAAGASRWLAYAGALLAAGGVVFLVFAHDRAAAELPRLVQVVGWAAAAGVAGTILDVPLKTVLLGGTGVGGLADEELLAGTLTSSYGWSALLRLAGLTVLFVGAVGLGTTATSAGFAAARSAGLRSGPGQGLPWAAPVALAGGGAALGSFVLAGHTMTARPRLLSWTADASHLAAVAVWLGGLVLLALVLRSRRRADDPAGGARVVRRFSMLALGSVLVVAVAGTGLGWLEVRSWQALTSTSYGWILVAKVAVVAAVVGIGAYNNRRLVPEIVRYGSVNAWHRLSRTVRIEAAALLVVALALTALLVNLPPARDQQAAAQVAPAGPYAELIPLGPEHQLELVVSPARAGANDVRVQLRDGSGAVADIAERVELRFSLPAAGIDRISREPERAGPGDWRYAGPELSIAGDWEIEVRVTVDEFQRLIVTATVPVAAGDTGLHEHQ
jgi:copper transport protein